MWMSGDVGFRLSTGQNWGWAGIGGVLAWSMMLWTSLSGGAAAFLQTHVSKSELLREQEFHSIATAKS